MTGGERMVKLRREKKRAEQEAVRMRREVLGLIKRNKKLAEERGVDEELSALQGK
jgi:PAB1-binding protein PBP1